MSMGRPNNRPEKTDLADATAEEILRSVTQDLHSLQQTVVAQLNQDVQRLQAQKSQLLGDIEELEAKQRSLQTQHQAALTRQQLAQQQLWAKQLAQALAKQLHVVLIERMRSQNMQPEAPMTLANDYSDNATRLLASLDATVSRTLSSVRDDLSTYQSSLSQQINRMQNLEQQGEAILEALVSRLNQQLQAEAARMQALSQAASQGSDGDRPSIPIAPPLLRPNPATLVSPVIAPEPTVASVRPIARPRLSQFQLGFVLILLSTVALSLHNVVVGIIGNTSQLFGATELGGFIRLNSLGNSLLILWMRMLVVVPLMALLARFLYPATWRDVQNFLRFKDRRLLWSVVGSGFFLFLSQVMIYIAIGQIGPGVAVTILFMYPLVTVPLAWLLFRDRPTSLRIGVMVAILSGVILTAFPKLTATAEPSWLGISTAVLSGIAFAFYLISMQISFRKLHPVPVSLIQFVTIFVFTSVSLIFRPFNMEVLPEGRPGLIVCGLILGSLTLAGYLLNNFGVRFMGAARASIVAASGPVLTALLAFLVIPGPRTALQGIQWLGILIVTLAVVALSLERMLLQRKAAKAIG